jgi:hypothetical protein
MKYCRENINWPWHHIGAEALGGRLLGRLKDRSETFDMSNPNIKNAFMNTYEHFKDEGVQYIEWMINDLKVLIKGKAYISANPLRYPKQDTDKFYNRKQWIPVYNNGYGKPLFVNPDNETTKTVIKVVPPKRAEPNIYKKTYTTTREQRRQKSL